MWAKIVPRLLELPYGILIPDCLGYAGTSKPTDPSLYSFQAMSDDFIEILDTESIESVIPVGHDWGSEIAQRVYLIHPEREVAMVCLNVAYRPPNAEKPFSLDESNATMERFFGYPALAYWEFLTAGDGVKIMNGNLERAYEVMHGDAEEWIKKIFCTRGAMRKYMLSEGESVPLKEYAKDPMM